MIPWLMGAALLNGVSFSHVRLNASLSVSGVIGWPLRRTRGHAANTKSMID